eukprot:NODE_1733_length_1235_cov_45.350181_g1718_i0.p1 GENE.NODE_1733_length_1235_cov_45.350181_g1718_i0~~NODE_1733_length_1235_cov_45.350181_g1718_i0.p1  ORF type:complete len:406 (-),score=50.31 NODE_1733_length_1235_cov_45.350181_g1718_i0:17-1123(-)
MTTSSLAEGQQHMGESDPHATSEMYDPRYDGPDGQAHMAGPSVMPAYASPPSSGPLRPVAQRSPRAGDLSPEATYRDSQYAYASSPSSAPYDNAHYDRRSPAHNEDHADLVGWMRPRSPARLRQLAHMLEANQELQRMAAQDSPHDRRGIHIPRNATPEDLTPLAKTVLAANGATPTHYSPSSLSATQAQVGMSRQSRMSPTRNPRDSSRGGRTSSRGPSSRSRESSRERSEHSPKLYGRNADAPPAYSTAVDEPQQRDWVVPTSSSARASFDYSRRQWVETPQSQPQSSRARVPSPQPHSDATARSRSPQRETPRTSRSTARERSSSPSTRPLPPAWNGSTRLVPGHKRPEYSPQSYMRKSPHRQLL